MEKIRKKHLFLMVLGVSLWLCVTIWCTYIRAKLVGEITGNYIPMIDYLSAVVVFVLIKYVFVIVKPKISYGRIGRGICFMGSLTLGIYLLDPCLRMLFWGKYDKLTAPIFPTLLLSCIWVIISMLCGSLITLVLKRTPFFRRII